MVSILSRMEMGMVPIKLANSFMNRLDDNADDGQAPSEAHGSRLQLPLYSVRQPPLIQPLHVSRFTAKLWEKYGIHDLGHEWVTLFQTIAGRTAPKSTRMKLLVPDTILLSPSGCVEVLTVYWA